LNSDTVITPWSWLAAKEAFEGDPAIGVTGPCTSHCATRQMIQRAMYCRHYWSDDQIFAFAQLHLSGLEPRQWVDMEEVGGFAFFLRQSLWKELGGFDVNLPDYGNESELCKRVLRRGLRIVWTRNSYIHHFGKQSYASTFGGKDRINERAVRTRQYIDQKYAAEPSSCPGSGGNESYQRGRRSVS
jgi:GT2 family glycosyltransferase